MNPRLTADSGASDSESSVEQLGLQSKEPDDSNGIGIWA